MLHWKIAVWVVNWCLIANSFQCNILKDLKKILNDWMTYSTHVLTTSRSYIFFYGSMANKAFLSSFTAVLNAKDEVKGHSEFKSPLASLACSLPWLEVNLQGTSGHHWHPGALVQVDARHDKQNEFGPTYILKPKKSQSDSCGFLPVVIPTYGPQASVWWHFFCVASNKCSRATPKTSINSG